MKMPKVRMWLEVGNMGEVDEEVEVPRHCFDEEDNLIYEDVVEYVEEWVQEKCRWGVQPVKENAEDS
jgi:hypothetical protein